MQNQQRPVINRKAGEGSIECVGVDCPVGERRFGRGRLPVVFGVEESNLPDLGSAPAAYLRPAGVQIDPPQPSVE